MNNSKRLIIFVLDNTKIENIHETIIMDISLIFLLIPKIKTNGKYAKIINTPLSKLQSKLKIGRTPKIIL